jgi:sterol desaturase/sphingolipid hydroxylase (fatty acid hydroxylase superfamily)
MAEIYLGLLYRWEVRLVLLCLAVLAAERFRPWRREQPVARKQLLQDLFWFGFNLFVVGMVFAPLFSQIAAALRCGYSLAFGGDPGNARLLARMPIYVQVPISLVAVDLVEWLTHNLLHRAPLLWRFHRLHHSIHDMDWIGNFRFHPLEIAFYYTTRFLPVALLGAAPETVAITGSIALLIGNLNHANLDLAYGPFRYLLNSPRMHIWHHEARVRGRAGVNFGIVFSAWDWVFRTAHMPAYEVPDRLGFGGDERFPDTLWRRLLLPFLDLPR